MSEEFSKVDADRQILANAHEKGAVSTMGAFVRLSGPGWLQSAITLGGGSLASALFLGVLVGPAGLWLQLVAISVGVVMLSAISYVTLSTGERPYQAINQHINPVLGVGWITATILANMIWIMPQFSLCFDVLDRNLGGESIKDDLNTKIIVSVVIFALAFGMILLSVKPGFMTRMFDLFLKLMVGIIVVCFVGVVIYLIAQGHLTGAVVLGFIPDFTQVIRPSEQIQALVDTLPEASREAWQKEVVNTQQQTMISTAATAVGLNMTFLLPYSMLNRGWDRPFRGLARFDLITGLAIPYILVTSCIVIAAAYSFHGKADADLLSNDPVQIRKSSFFGGVAGRLDKEIAPNSDEMTLKQIADLKPETETEIEEQKAAKEARLNSLAKQISTLSAEERTLHVTMLKPNTAQLAKSLEPFLGEKASNYVFGIGALGMGFSTIIVLMMINGFAFRELLGMPSNQLVGVIGSLLAGLVGVAWIWVWAGESKTWVIIMASVFGMMLLPIAYVTFMAMMNSKSLLGNDKPTGIRMAIWNVLMAICVVAASAAAGLAVYKESQNVHGEFVIGAVVTFVILTVIGFSARPSRKA